MRKENKIYMNKDKYVKVSDVHREFGEWCKITEIEIDPIVKKQFNYYINLLPSIEIDDEKAK